jgi:hypothetical protein
MACFDRNSGKTGRDIFETLLENPGVDIHEKSEGSPLLVHAVRRGIPADCLRQLIAKGAKTDYRNAFGCNLLMSVFPTTPEVTCEHLRILLAAGVGVNEQDKDGKTALAYVFDYGFSPDSPISAEEARVLLDHGADPNLATRDGVTPLFRAVERIYVSSVEVLLAKGADPSIKGYGKTPLEKAQELLQSIGSNRHIQPDDPDLQRLRAIVKLLERPRP